ncbi:MBL fold metallo-hydrolase [Flavobacteriaceae bacterium]|jgi:glyoxylase-like metal-dependent hydrolase (beta-lactamase superfamily II)|uniref:MBL fold metallo-hydrolase n=1 Tax=Candidatus Arcticimaribacter forsetii TaxID=2820661 RepID=UPI0020772C56|nr:MBL fold metallo-hydrolase [Candidatus Arcticimaribacter forsetii]MDA8639807.1 MBL fold metallo-hydrolase [Flavobacteriaceae bacterium]MDA8698613.1 MBL fold metallo-hydrolase [Flavobacteriaceae bacterium]MDB2329630.1 MBL fold metallo-hydrolase [Flavobacteriaceae bacterium]MDB4609282.1 MBL fold metallo-hydrolase [Flavobacteriaceae bacterium]MDB4621103.1 MBL fold metallo-hydrolase [Flavobacteriaceae bacterium]
MKLHRIETGNFMLDGGAMFGVVPKALWERTNPADEKNRIKMAARSLLIEDGDRLILIDTGMGNKQSDKFFGHYALWGNHSLDNSLKAAGFHRDDITDVFLTHLHFDHCGGAIQFSRSGALEPAFKNAHFWSHKNHWDWASNPNSREKASFLSENILPISESGQLKLLKETDRQITTPLGFDVLLMDGHTEKQMLPLIEYKGKTIVFAADLIPTVGHLPIPYVMGYDTRPLLTLEEKASFLKRALEDDFLLYLEHDPDNELISLEQTPKGVRCKESFQFDASFNS